MMRCIPCNGSKVVKPLGNMEKRCPECEGVGYIMAVEPKIEMSVVSDPANFNTDAEVKPMKTSKEAIQARLIQARAKRRVKNSV